MVFLILENATLTLVPLFFLPLPCPPCLQVSQFKRITLSEALCHVCLLILYLTLELMFTCAWSETLAALLTTTFPISGMVPNTHGRQ